MYFVGIWKFSPYSETISMHNHFLKLNHGTVVLFYFFFIIPKWVNPINEKIYVVGMYITIILLTLVVFGGYIRIYVEYKYRVINLEETH